MKCLIHGCPLRTWAVTCKALSLPLVGHVFPTFSPIRRAVRVTFLFLWVHVKVASLILVHPKPLSIISLLSFVPSGPIGSGKRVALADGAMAAMIINATKVALIFMLVHVFLFHLSPINHAAIARYCTILRFNGMTLYFSS